MGLLTDSARRIGAVNTISARVAADGSRILVGDNTDWVAIHRLVEQVRGLHFCICVQHVAGGWCACIIHCRVRSFPDRKSHERKLTTTGLRGGGGSVLRCGGCEQGVDSVRFSSARVARPRRPCTL